MIVEKRPLLPRGLGSDPPARLGLDITSSDELHQGRPYGHQTKCHPGRFEVRAHSPLLYRLGDGGSEAMTL